MTTRDQVRRAVRAERGDARGMPAEPAPGPARAPACRPRAQGRRPVPRRTRHEDPGPLPRRARARRLPRAPGRRLHQGLPAQLRAVSRPGPGRRPAPVAARARGSARAAGRHHGPAPDRHAAQGPDLLAEPRRLRAADRRRAGLRRLPRRPAAALRQAADDRGDRSRRRPSSTSTSRRPNTSCAARRTRAPRSRSPRRAATRTASTADADGKWNASVELRRGRNQFEVTAVDPDTGKKSENAVSLFITVPFLVIEAPTLTVDQPAEGATFENGAIPVQGRTTNAEFGRGERQLHRARPTPPAGRRRATRATGCARAGHGHGRRGRHVRHAVRAHDRPLGDHGHGLEPRGQDDLADAQRHRRLQGRQPRRVDRRRPRLDQGLGRRQDRSRDRRRGQGLRQRQARSRSTARNRSRSGPARRA